MALEYRYTLRLGERYGYQSVAIWGEDLPSALAEALKRQQEPLKIGFTARDVLDVTTWREPDTHELSVREEEDETRALLGEA